MPEVGDQGDGRALFVPFDGGDLGEEAGRVWLPTAYSRGPWSPDSLHGGPVAALLVRAAERVEAPIPVRLARITVELLRPVPFVPLVVEASVLRPGKKVSTVDLTLRIAEGTGSVGVGGNEGDRNGVGPNVLAVARVQRIRTAEIEFPDGASDEVPPFPSEPTAVKGWPGVADVTFHANAVEHRFVSGHFTDPGPAVDWIRLVVPLVPGEEPTGWQRAAACADFTNGLSSVAPFDGRSAFINPDLTVNLWREPQGEWICSDAVTRTSGSGIGLAQTDLWDRTGRCGTGLQSLYLDR